MEGDRELAALARIETALARISAATPAASTSGSEQDRRYAELRASVEASIAEIDSLIAGLRE